MAFYTSAYKLLSHLAPNWDTQLRADMQSLEDNLAEVNFAPGIGGTGTSAGSSAGFTGLASRKGNHLSLDGLITFGSSASLGNGTPVITNLAQVGLGLSTTITGGFGQLRPISGAAPTQLMFTPVSSSTVAIRLAATGALYYTTPAQSDQLYFHVEGVGA